MRDRIERLADLTPGIDPWCSGPDWVLPVHQGFAADVPVIAIGDMDRWGGLMSVYTFDGEDGKTGMTGAEGPSAPVVVAGGAEPLWGFACPILAPEPALVMAEIVDALEDLGPWSQLYLPGFTLDAPLFGALAEGLGSIGEVRATHSIVRCVADIGDGVGSWLDQRSARFRQQFRRWQRIPSGLEIEDVTESAGLMDRLVAIEQRGWKGADDGGITSPAMEVTYRTMIDMLAERRRLRASIAIVDGRDEGFILGGIRGETYRGLQLSYAEGARELSLGNRLQCHQLMALEESGVQRYDMGMEMPYKVRFADRLVPSVAILVAR